MGIEVEDLYAIPTWVITNAATPFLPRKHPWRWRWFELHDWARSRTPFCSAYDSVLWCVTVEAVVLYLLLA